MSIKQGEYLKKLRKENNLSQEQLAEILGLSRQSISKWEQGTSTPDIDNFVKLSKIYKVSIDSLLNGEDDGNTAISVDTDVKSDTGEEKQKKKRGWLFTSYPIIMIIAYMVIGAVFGKMGWAIGWIILLTIPIFYTTIIAVEKKKPVIFCYPALVLIIFLLCGFLLDKWHPMWIIFLTIPIFYIVTAKINKK